jgi:DNA (cytosine-5)-methyltransferase 1
MKNLIAISLFSGAGGLDIGFKRAGMQIRLAVEIDPSCCDTLKKNMPDTVVLNADVTSLSGQELCFLAGVKVGEVDCVFGGPPCQSFSLAGNRKGLSDDRGKLIGHFLRLIKEIAPRTFVMENVKGMANWDNGAVLGVISEEFAKTVEHREGTFRYDVEHRVLNAVDFGAPQRRERIFVVGNRLGKKMLYPQPTHGNIQNLNFGASLKPFSTVGEAILDLPAPDAPSATALRVSGTIKARRENHGY